MAISNNIICLPWILHEVEIVHIEFNELLDEKFYIPTSLSTDAIILIRPNQTILEKA